MLRNLNQLYTQAENVSVLYDATGRSSFAHPKIQNIINYTAAEHAAMGFPLTQDKDIMLHPNKALRTNPSRYIYFNPEYEMIAFAKQHPEFDYYYRIEYDVWFNGHWDYFFTLCDQDCSDFLGLYVRPKDTGMIYRYAWDTINFPVEKEYLYGSFFPIQRYSKKLLETLEKEYLSGKYGYCEVIVPTLAKMNGLVVKDFNAFDFFYTTTTVRTAPHPSWGEKYFINTPDMLYHPVR